MTLKMEERGASLEELLQVISGNQTRKMYFEGDLNVGLLACGQGVGLVREIKPIRHIISEIIEEAIAVRKRLDRLLS